MTATMLAPKKKSPAKKAPAKKPDAIPDSTLKEVAHRLRSGKSKLFEESKRLGFADNSPLRKALREHLGGKPAYEKLIAEGMAARKPEKK